jgi:alkanesulfonate monooxygenase SsuD/methylene tetrahydromethanopterin reductase-like flavin-dependent oxidoreductase (luciferase family)
MTRSTPFAVLLDIDGAGSHPASARRLPPDADPHDPRRLAAHVQAAERAGFTAVTFADDHRLDAPARLDAVVRASFAAPLTGALGLIPVLPALYNEPFHTATQLIALDTASHGRAGVLAVADASPELAARHGRTALDPSDPSEADAELADVVEAWRRLWDSWEDDAVIREAATGRYLDRAKLHYADFEGRRFRVKGPAITPRPPQGQPLVIGPDGTHAEADAVVIDVGAGGREPWAAIVRTAERARRDHAAGTRLLVELDVALDHAGVDAAARLAGLDALGAAAPAVPAVRDAADGTRAARHPSRPSHIGDAAGLVGFLTFLAEHVDGVRLFPAELGIDLDELANAVLPELRARGILVSPRAGSTLRENWGLTRPANRYLEAAR